LSNIASFIACLKAFVDWALQLKEDLTDDV
jgi:hypothetical protein